MPQPPDRPRTLREINDAYKQRFKNSQFIEHAAIRSFIKEAILAAREATKIKGRAYDGDKEEDTWGAGLSEGFNSATDDVDAAWRVFLGEQEQGGGEK